MGLPCPLKRLPECRSASVILASFFCHGLQLAAAWLGAGIRRICRSKVLVRVLDRALGSVGHCTLRSGCVRVFGGWRSKEDLGSDSSLSWSWFQWSGMSDCKVWASHALGPRWIHASSINGQTTSVALPSRLATISSTQGAL